MMSWRELPSSWEADQNQRAQARVKPQPDRGHWGWARQRNQDGFSEEVMMEPTGKVGKE